MKLGKCFLQAGLIVLLCTLSVFTAGAAVGDSPKPIMHRIFAALTELLKDSLSENHTRNDPKALQREVALLSDSTAELESHAQGQSVGFRLMSRSLADAVREFRYYYDARRQEEARFFLVDLTQSCVACHTRLPSARDFPLGQRLLDNATMGSLALQDQAQLQVVARRFHDALTSWEKVFSDPLSDPVAIDAEGNLLDYLLVAIRALHDLDRPARTLKVFLKRDDLPFYLRYYIEFWLQRLQLLKDELKGEPRPYRARRLFERASQMKTFPEGQEQTIDDLVASAILYRYLDGQGKSVGLDVAEAYHLLGMIEGRTLQRAWAVPPFEQHFEAAIRSAPQGPYAKRSFAIVQEYVINGFSGTEAVQRLEELRALIGLPAEEREPPPHFQLSSVH